MTNKYDDREARSLMAQNALKQTPHEFEAAIKKAWDELKEEILALNGSQPHHEIGMRHEAVRLAFMGLPDVALHCSTGATPLYLIDEYQVRFKLSSIFFNPVSGKFETTEPEAEKLRLPNGPAQHRSPLAVIIDSAMKPLPVPPPRS